MNMGQGRNKDKRSDFWMIIRKGPNLMDEKKYALDLLTRKGVRIGPGTIVYDTDLKGEDQKYIAKILIKVLKEKRILLDTGTISYESFLDDSDCDGLLLLAKVKGMVDEGIIKESYEVRKTYRKLSDVPGNSRDIHGFNVPNKDVEFSNKSQRPPNLDKITYPNNTPQSIRNSKINAKNPYSEVIRDNNPVSNPYIETIADSSQFKEKVAIAKEEANWEKLSEKKEGCFIATAVYGSYDCEEVLYLRRVRDEILYQSLGGRLFIKFYYSWSPFIASVISNNNVIMRFIRGNLDYLITFLKKYLLKN